MTAESVLKSVLLGLERQSPTILTGLGVTGFITTIGLTIDGTKKAICLIECAEERHTKILTKKEVIRITWKCYIPAAISGVVTIGCFIGANSINLRRNAILAGLYSVSESALEAYQQNVVEILGKTKAEKIHDAIVQKKLDDNPVSGNEVIVTGKGEVLFYDSWSGRYFKSDMEAVRRAQNDLNAELLGGGMYIPLNDLYDELGLEAVESGNMIGWTLDGILNMTFTSKIAEGVPCVVIEYKPRPKEF